jgi:hypothetical protein
MPSALTWAARLTEPRLQTATSSRLVLSRISVQRFELWTTPAWSCGLRTLAASLKVSQGCPVSKRAVSMARQRSTARSCLALAISPRATAASYSA